MRGWHSLLRSFSWLVFVALDARAEGEDPKDVCIQAHESGQSALRDGRLRAAREDFIRCSQPACPSVLRSDCSDRVERISGSIPTVVVRARDADGADVLDASLYVDGKLVKKTLDGRALELDPGRHAFRCVDARGHAAEQTFAVLEGRQNQLVEIQVGTPRSQPPAPETDTARSRPPYLAYAIGGFGLVAIGSFAYFGLTGKAKERKLDECAPLCERSDYRAMQRDYIAADVSLGAGAVLLGLATYLLATHEEKPGSARMFGIRPETGGASLKYGASF